MYSEQQAWAEFSLVWKIFVGNCFFGIISSLFIAGESGVINGSNSLHFGSRNNSFPPPFLIKSMQISLDGLLKWPFK